MAIIVIYSSNLHDKIINTFIGDHSDSVGIVFMDCWEFVDVMFVIMVMIMAMTMMLALAMVSWQSLAISNSIYSIHSSHRNQVIFN